MFATTWSGWLKGLRNHLKGMAQPAAFRTEEDLGWLISVFSPCG